MQGLCRGRNRKAIRTHREYFIRHQSRMAYAKLMAMKLPIGSGAIESTVRRVVNLRLKGPSIFWCRASAEAILLLRSYYKAGRPLEGSCQEGKHPPYTPFCIFCRGMSHGI